MQVSYRSLFVCFDLYPRHIAPALMLQRTPPQADQDRKDEPVFGAGILSRLRCKTAFLSRQKHDVKSGAFPLCQLQIGTGKLHPELVSEWSEKNLTLTPDDITFGSNKKVWWRGACGHEWQASVKARSNGEKCPICSGARVIAGINDLATLEPLLVKQWSKKNKIKPIEVSIGSHKKVIWRCKKGHEWEAAVKSRTINKTGCPYCSYNKVLAGFNDFATLMPDIAAEWSDRNYPLLPTQVTVFANRKAWWKCKDCGREWNTLISTRSGGSKCPYCSGYIFLKGFSDLQTTHPEIASEMN